MLKELLLSLAISAASGVPFLDSPKRVDGTSTFYEGSYYADIDYYGYDNMDISLSFPFAVNETEVLIDEGDGGEMDFTPTNVNTDIAYNFHVAAGSGFWDHDGTFDWILSFYVDYESYAQTIVDYFNNLTGNVSSMLGFSTIVTAPHLSASKSLDGSYYLIEIYFSVAFNDIGSNQGEAQVVYQPSPEYTLTKTFTNCAGYVVGGGGVLSPLPNSYTQAELQNPYTCRFYASDGYYFDNRTIAANITQSGGIVISDVVFDTPLNNDRYTTGFSCSITLPLANCSLSAVANAFTYTITSELNRCSVSGLPSTYTNELSGNYVFIAASNYGFNKNSVSYEITGATYEVSYSGVLYGDFYQNLTISIEAHFSNVSIRVTAVSYDPDPYRQGFSDGEKKGYEEGKIAGNSYGVWNWLKQAAATTGEFLNIPLLPGFSLGGLLTAIAGLVIIWLFVKGFLFKS